MYDVRRVMVGGEELTTALRDRFIATLPGASLYNTYGPSEATVDVTWHMCRDGEPTAPIGKLMANTQAYVLDDALRLVPIGRAGELYLAGAPLARGYLNQPGLTAARFVADPYGPPGSRMYRTGDLARWRSAGELEYHGRSDNQVQVHGVRVELGEIEAVLADYPGVRQAVVLQRAGQPEASALVAYVTGSGADARNLRGETLRSALADRLPTAFVPSVVVVVDELPMLPSGKVDRISLAARPLPEIAPGCGRAPRTPREELLCQLFADLLGEPRVSIDDSFFALGGHSMLATRLIGRMRSAVGADISIRDVFEAPTVAGLVRRIETAEGSGVPLVPMSRPAHVPLSPGQRRLWFLNHMEDSTATYNVPMVLRLSGELDRDALAAAIGDLVDRHEILRTLFPEVDGEPVQTVLSARQARPALPLAEGNEDDLVAWAADLCRRPFDLSSEIPLRVGLFRLGNSEHALAIVLHHIAIDEWSDDPLNRDLSAAYAARRAGHAPTFAPLPVQYADYTLWQQRALGSRSDPLSTVARLMAYWTRALDGLPDELALPCDRPRPVVASQRGGREPLRLDAAAHARLVRLANEQNVTMFMAVHTALTVLLSRLSASTDIPVGAPVTGRADHALEDLIGFFINTVVLRTDLSGDPTFLELLVQVRRNHLAAYAHQDLPFEHLVEELNPERSAARHPLFQVMLVWQRRENPEPVLPGLTATALRFPSMTAKFDLLVTLEEEFGPDGGPAGVSGSVEFAADLFDVGTVRLFADGLVRVLGVMSADPSGRVGDVDVLSAAERVEALRGGRGAVVGVSGGLLPELFAEQVARAPDRLAVQDGSGALSYAELDARANRLSRLLIGRGIGPESFVAVMLPRSVDLVIAFLAVLKAGAAYLPIPVDYPAERASLILSDAGPAVVVTAAAVRPEVCGVTAPCPVLVLDDADTVAALAGSVATDPGAEGRLSRLTADTPAYVIYTSGSTGRPKGVVVTGRVLMNLMAWYAAEVSADPAARVAQFSAIGFDMSVYEILSALLNGKTLVIPDEQARIDPARLADWLDREAIHEFFAPDLVVRAVYEAAIEQGLQLPALRHVVQAGEALHLTDQVRAFHAQRPGIRLHNHYGPSETHVITAQPFGADPAGWPATAPIGSPIWNCQTFVLDAALRPVPAGVIGELYLAGAGMARGYLNRAGLTAERFVANPFGPPGSRMYRSGDLARWRAGRLEFVGRVDDQVKIRGVRVEPGEISAVLSRHPAVGQAVTVVRETDPRGKHLVAYITLPRNGTGRAGRVTVHVDDLRRHVAAAVPAAMIPAAFVTLDEFPLTANGKLDQAALPEPRWSAPPISRLPTTPQEQALCDLFGQLLNVTPVSIDDNFFSMGGHSLLAARLINHIRHQLDAELDVRDVFLHPTPAGLASRLDRSAGPSRAPLTAVAERARPARMPLSHAQRRMWFLDQMGSGSAYVIANAWRLRGEWHPTQLQAALDDVVDRHEALRTVYPVVDGEPVQRVLADARVAWAQSSCAEADLARAVERSDGHVFDLAAEVPVRVDVFEVSETDHVVVLAIHHIACDGWSMGPLLADLATAYAARLAGRAPAWQPLPVQYADYTLWQHTVLGDPDDAGSLLARQLDYWRSQLAGLPEEVTLPTDRPRLARSSRGGTVDAKIPADLHAAITRLARTRQVTVFMVLQAAVAALLHRMGAGSDIPLGSVVAGRSDPAADELVGFFVNTVVLRTDLSGDPTFLELLDRVRETDLAALSHQDLPFDRLVEKLNPERSADRHPLFQVMLVLQNLAEADLALPGLDIREQPVGGTSARFDLLVTLEEEFGPDGGPAGVSGSVEFAADLFDVGTVRLFADGLVRVLGVMSADPSGRVGDVDVLSAAERVEALRGGRGAVVGVSGGLLPELFAEQVARAPDRLAVQDGSGALSYAELDARANRLSRLLIGRGIGPESFVAVMLPRSVDLVIAFLAVLKAGAAYLPIPVDYPAERASLILSDAGPAVVVTAAAVRPEVCGVTAPCPVLVLDDADTVAALAGSVATDPGAEGRLSRLTADTPAYVIYTSGSTGRPKGVVLTGQGIANLQGWYADAVSADPAARVAQFSAIGFDVSVHEILSALLNGKTLVIPDEQTRIDPVKLAGWLERETITELLAPDLVVRAVYEAAIEQGLQLPALRHVVQAGEALHLTDQVRAFHAQRPGIRLHNHYGPSETSPYITGYPFDPDIAGWPDTVPIGSPIWNCQTFVLDQVLRPVPAGVIGELYLAGAGMARGYLNQPGLTAARFVANPYGPPGSRMYRSGDLARWRAGRLEFVGRVDDQVKIRGVRVEPGEISAVLSRHPAVGQAVTVVRETDPRGKHLVAYTTTAHGATTAHPDDLRRHVAATLPTAMIPTAFVAIDEIPLTTNGKLNHAALPEPQHQPQPTNQTPTTPREQALCHIFSQLLNHTPITPHDNFFTLGGHSLLAARLINQIRHQLGTELSIRTLFAAPTPAELARHLHVTTERESLDVLIPLRQGGSLPPLFCLPPAAGLSWVYSGLLGYLEPDRPVYGLQSRRYTDPAAEPDVDEMVGDFVTQIRTVRPDGPYHLLGWSFGGHLAHAVAARLAADDTPVGLVAVLDAYPVTPDPTDERLAADDPRALAELLRSLGLDAGTGHPVQRADLAGLAAQRDNPLSGLGPAALAALPEVFTGNRNALLRHRTGHFDGELLFFAATQDKYGDPLTWRKHVSGAVEIHEIDCGHGDMVRPDPLTRIGPAVASWLARRDGPSHGPAGGDR